MAVYSILIYCSFCSSLCFSWTILSQGNVRDIPETQNYHHPHFQENLPESEIYDEDDVFTEWSSYTDMEEDQQISTDDSTDWKFWEDASQNDIVDYVNADTGDTVLQIGQELRMTENVDERVVANVQVLAVVDYCLYRRYLRQFRNNKREAQIQIERYYRILFSMVDQRFSTIQSPLLSIHVSLVGVVIPKNRAEASFLENSVVWPRTVRNGIVNVDTALQKFHMWLRRKYSDLPTYDHAVAFTGHRLYKGKRKVDGLAYIGTICRSLEGKSSSVVYDNGDFLAVGITTHELGHSLGATHDGDYLNAGCSADHDNIMSPRQATKSKATTSMFYFSDCSIRQMTRHLQNRRECLTGTRQSYNHVGNNSPGSIYGLTKQCQMVFGSKSDFCQRPGHYGINDDVCGRLWCTNPDNARICQTKSRLVALPGTICSHNKICHLGNCLEPSTIQYHSNELGLTKPATECPTGDKDPSYCTFVAKKYGRNLICEHNLIGAYCCHTCSMIL